MKRFVSILMVALILALTLNYNSFVYADEPEQEHITQYSVNLIYNNQNIPKESYQTQNNYNTYYDLLSGTLKTAISFNGYISNNNNENQFEGFYNSINYVGNDDKLDFNELSFKPIVINEQTIDFSDCKYFITFYSDNYGDNLYLYLVYCPDQSNH